METTKQKRTKKYSREDPQNLRPRRITTRDLEIIDIINRYRFIPTSQLVRLIDGDIRSTEARLPHLYHRGYINRFAFPTSFHPGEFNYFLDDKKALDLLKENRWEKERLHYKNVYNNRNKNYDLAFSQELSSRQGQLSHLNHELMISRFHYMLEKACRNSKGTAELVTFLQGSDVWNEMEMTPAYMDPGGNVVEKEETQKISNRPDAFFGLRFPSLPESEKTYYYFYEADRNTMNITTMLDKFRRHFHYIVEQKKHIADYGVKRIRAVLVESTSGSWANHLRRKARHPIVAGQKPTNLFWFTRSRPFEQKVPAVVKGKEKDIPRFLNSPELVFQKIWATPAQRSKDLTAEIFKSIIPSL